MKWMPSCHPKLGVGRTKKKKKKNAYTILLTYNPNHNLMLVTSMGEDWTWKRNLHTAIRDGGLFSINKNYFTNVLASEGLAILLPLGWALIGCWWLRLVTAIYEQQPPLGGALDSWFCFKMFLFTSASVDPSSNRLGTAIICKNSIVTNCTFTINSAVMTFQRKYL